MTSTNPNDPNEDQGDEQPVVREYWTTVAQIRHDIARATGRDRRRAHATPAPSVTLPARTPVDDDQAPALDRTRPDSANRRRSADAESVGKPVGIESSRSGRLRKQTFVGDPVGARLRVALLGVAYLGAAVGANWATSAYGLVPAGFGLTVTAGTYCAGLALAVRDTVQDAIGARLAVALIALACLVSAVLAEPGIAVASAVAFALAELLDMAVYTPLRRRGRRRAVAVSGAVGAVADSVVFLLVAGFGLTAASLGGQLLVKAVWVTGGYLAVVEVARRALPRERIIAGSA